MPADGIEVNLVIRLWRIADFECGLRIADYKVTTHTDPQVKQLQYETTKT